MSIPALDQVLVNFRQTLKSDVKSLMRLYQAEAKGPGRPGHWMSAITRSAIVLLAANLENFVERLFCTSFSHLAAQSLIARSYPERFRHWLFHEEANMRNIGIDTSREFIQLSLKLYSDIRPLTDVELKLERLRERFANPTPANIEWLLSLLDLDSKYLQDMTLGKDKTEARAVIGELANRRNKIAHGDSSENPTYEDVERLTKFCQLFANRITRDVSARTEQCLK